MPKKQEPEVQIITREETLLQEAYSISGRIRDGIGAILELLESGAYDRIVIADITQGTRDDILRLETTASELAQERSKE